MKHLFAIYVHYKHLSALLWYLRVTDAERSNGTKPNQTNPNSNDVDKIKEHLANHILNDHPSVKAFCLSQSNETHLKLDDDKTKESKEA